MVLYSNSSFCRNQTSQPLPVHRHRHFPAVLVVLALRFLLFRFSTFLASPGHWSKKARLLNCEENFCPVHLVNRNGAKKRNPDELARLQKVAPNSQWQRTLSSENCQKIDLNRIASHLVPHWHCFRFRVFKLAVPRVFFSSEADAAT